MAASVIATKPLLGDADVVYIAIFACPSFVANADRVASGRRGTETVLAAEGAMGACIPNVTVRACPSFVTFTNCRPVQRQMTSSVFRAWTLGDADVFNLALFACPPLIASTARVGAVCRIRTDAMLATIAVILACACSGAAANGVACKTVVADAFSFVHTRRIFATRYCARRFFIFRKLMLRGGARAEGHYGEETGKPRGYSTDKHATSRLGRRNNLVSHAIALVQTSPWLC